MFNQIFFDKSILKRIFISLIISSFFSYTIYSYYDVLIVDMYGNSNTYIFFIFTYILFFSASFFKAAKLIIIMVSIPIVLMLPFLATYGTINSSHIIAFFATNKNESYEFLKNTPLKAYISPIIFGVLLYSYFKLKTVKIKNVISNTIIFIIFLFFTFYKFAFTSTFYQFTYYAFNDYKNQMYEFEKHQNDKLSINILKKNLKPYHNYVVVIGESMPKQYTSLYGYPVKTTPFLDTVKGKVIGHYISASQTTVPSLTRSFSSSYPSLVNNVINLANQAGYKTFWLSNQYQLGSANFSVTTIAKNSNVKIFLNSVAEKSSLLLDSSHFDDELFPHFQNIIKNNAEPKVIFVHLIGSHPFIKDRVKGKAVFDSNISKDLDYLLTSYKNTDTLLKSIYNELCDNKKPFSIIYFSDHGLTVLKNSIKHGREYQQNYDVPFIMISSDDKEHKIINKTISAFSFMDIYASWLGLETNQTKYYKKLEDLPNNSNVQVFDGKKIVPYNQLDSLEVLKPSVK